MTSTRSSERRTRYSDTKTERERDRKQSGGCPAPAGTIGFVGHQHEQGILVIRAASAPGVKFFFSGVELDPIVASLRYTRFAEQFYAEGQSGPASLQAEGSGSVSVEGLAAASTGS